MSRRFSYRWLWVVMSVCSVFAVVREASAQVATHHMHKEASAGGLLLLPAGPDASPTVVASANFKNTLPGEHLVRTFESPTVAAASGGVIPAPSAVAITVWMSKSGNQASMVPKVKVFLNSVTGTPLCVASGASALTTTLTAYVLSCTTATPVAVAPSDRFVVWVGVDVTVIANGNYSAQLGVEGVLGGRSDSRVVMPLVLSASRGAVGSSVTIAGVNFGPASGGQVGFGGAAGVPTSWTNTSITLPVPAGATSGPVVVSAGGVSSLGSPFIVVPAITGVAPASGLPGTAVVLSGTSFGTIVGRVAFGGTPAPVTSWSDTRVVAVVPDGAPSGMVTLTVGGVLVAGGPFEVLAPPALSTLSPAEGAAGSTITLDGAHFGDRQAGDGVTVGGLAAAVTSWTDTRIVATVPFGATTGLVVVTARGLASNGLLFTVRLPGVSVLSPSSGAVLPVGQTPVSAVVSGLSGAIALARCNGVEAAIDGGAISCVVPVRKGRNAIVVQVVDTAGHEEAGSVVIGGVAPPTVLVATPSRYTMSAGEHRSVQLTDDSGRVVTEATWTSEQPGVVGVDVRGELTALAPGTTDVVASAGGLVVRVPVEVVEGALPTGTPAWTIDPTPGWYQYATTAVDAASAAFVAAEVQYDDRFLVSAMQLRAFDDDGRQSVLIAVPVSPVVQTLRLMGDALGGVLVVATGSTARTITRLAVDPSDVLAWEQRVSGDLDAGIAQGPDGTIFTMSGRTTFYYAPAVRDPLIVGIDGRTGRRRFAVAPVAPSFCASGGGYSELSRFDAPLTVDTEGVAHVLGIVRDQNGVSPESCGPTPLGDIYLAARVVHYGIAPDGTTTATDLYRHASDSTYFTFRGRFFTVPDDQGGVLAAWEWCAGAQVECRTLARHVGAGQVGDVFELPHQFGWGEMVSASGRTAYYGGRMTPAMKFDMATGGVSWRDESPGAPVAARADGRVEVQRFGVGRMLVDTNGALAAAPATPVATPVLSTAGRWRVTADRGDLSAVVDDGFMPDQAGFAVAFGGGLQGRGAAPGSYGVFFKGHEIPGTLGLGRHGSIRIVPRNQLRWRTTSSGTFTYQDASGLFYATLGAGPGLNHVRSVDTTSACLEGGEYLTNAVNFDTDRLAPPVTPLERLRYAPMNEDAVIANLLVVDATYQDGLSYCWNPYYLNLPFYNSNSYISGLLREAGVPAPQTPRTTTGYLGWDKPVPAGSFNTVP